MAIAILSVAVIATGVSVLLMTLAIRRQHRDVRRARALIAQERLDLARERWRQQ